MGEKLVYKFSYKYGLLLGCKKIIGIISVILYKTKIIIQRMVNIFSCCYRSKQHFIPVAEPVLIEAIQVLPMEESISSHNSRPNLSHNLPNLRPESVGWNIYIYENNNLVHHNPL